MRALACLLLCACAEPPIDPDLLPPPVGPILPDHPCPAHTRPELGQKECVPVGAGACADPFESDGSEWGCRAIAASDCSPGTAPRLGSTSCELVGWTECFRGFELDGGTCIDISSPTPCTGTTRAAL